MKVQLRKNLEGDPSFFQNVFCACTTVTSTLKIGRKEQVVSAGTVLGLVTGLFIGYPAKLGEYSGDIDKAGKTNYQGE